MDIYEWRTYRPTLPEQGKSVLLESFGKRAKQFKKVLLVAPCRFLKLYSQGKAVFGMRFQTLLCQVFQQGPYPCFPPPSSKIKLCQFSY